jgi:antagonist of KipI
MPALTVLRPGMLTTVQDLGRWGYQSSGVPVAGPMDLYSHRRANRLVGNDDSVPALEVTLIGPELQADGDVVCAVAGARFSVSVGGVLVPPDAPFVAPAGQRIRFGPRAAGARATLAVRGGFALPETFGSRATSLVSGMGPFGGRALATGDVLPIGTVRQPKTRAVGPPLALPAGGTAVRVMLGPHEAMFTSAARDALFGSRFTVTPSSNRMGYRLDGPPLERVGPSEILSDATPIGSLQVPASGLPILLMADRQTTGGYPKIGTVITADLPLAGQLAPGDWVEFTRCTRAAAVAALRLLERRLAGSS